MTKARKTRTVTLHRKSIEKMRKEGLTFPEMGRILGLPPITISRFYRKLDSRFGGDKYKNDTYLARTTFPAPVRFETSEAASVKIAQPCLPLEIAPKNDRKPHLLGDDLKEALKLVLDCMEGSGISLITITPEGKVTIKRHSEGILQL